MQIPRKIDDRIKDAIINIQFLPGIPTEAVIGYTYSLIGSQFSVSSARVGTVDLPFEVPDFINDEQAFFMVKPDIGLRVEIENDQINFNLYNGYIGWDEYGGQIKSVLQPLFEKKVIRRVTRIGLRYISEFNGVSIFENIKATIQLHPFNEHLLASHFRTEFPIEQVFYAIINVTNLYPTISAETKKPDGGFSSTIDIDVIKPFTGSERADYESLLNYIERAHNEQKKLFFSLLKEDFINTLNPIY